MSLMLANYEDKIWNGIEIKRGQFLTSRKNFAKSSHTTEQKVRDFWHNLTRVGFLTTKRTNRYTLITICNYDRYQNLSNYLKEKEPTEEPTRNQQRTTTKEYIKKEKEINRDFEETFGTSPKEVLHIID